VENSGNVRYRLPDICARCGRIHAPLSWESAAQVAEHPWASLLGLLGGLLIVSLRTIAVSLPVCTACEAALVRCRRLCLTAKWVGTLFGVATGMYIGLAASRDVVLAIILAVLCAAPGAVAGFMAAGIFTLRMKARLIVIRRGRIAFGNAVFQREFSRLNPLA